MKFTLLQVKRWLRLVLTTTLNTSSRTRTHFCRTSTSSRHTTGRKTTLLLLPALTKVWCSLKTRCKTKWASVEAVSMSTVSTAQYQSRTLSFKLEKHPLRAQTNRPTCPNELLIQSWTVTNQRSGWKITKHSNRCKTCHSKWISNNICWLSKWMQTRDSSLSSKKRGLILSAAHLKIWNLAHVRVISCKLKSTTTVKTTSAARV